jgi:hypothetical protein
LSDSGAAFGFSDAARRMADQVNRHIEAQGFLAHGRWAAIRLADGGSDGVLYDRRADAVRHQRDERYCTYVQVPPNSMTPREAEAVLRFTRFAYDHGYRITSPEDPEPIMPLRSNALDSRLTGATR